LSGQAAAIPELSPLLYRMKTKEIYTYKMIQKTNAAYLELHNYTSREKNTQSFVSDDTGDCCCCELPLDATSFESGYHTTEEMVCSAFSDERVCNSSATCISHTISHGATQPSVHLRLVQEIRACAKTRDTLHKVWDELDYRLDICR
jgi:hypothetical protein